MSMQDPSISAGVQQPDLQSQSLLQTMDPQSSLQLQMQALQQAQFEGLPDYNTQIKGILQLIGTTTQRGQSAQDLDLNAAADNIYKLSQAVHLLAQSNSEEGEAIPARIQVRLEGAKLQMEQAQQTHQMMLNEQDQQHKHALALQQQNHQQILDTQKQAHEQALAQQMHQAQLEQMAQQAQLQAQNQQHQQQLAEQAQAQTQQGGSEE